MNRTARRMAAGAALLVAAPVVMSSVAYACQTLATLHATTPTVTAGQSVTLFGKNYAGSVSPAEAPQPSAISIRLDTRTGPVIGTFAPTANRVLSGTVVIPADVAAGEHTILATQTTADGAPVNGTPGRATVTVNVLASSRTSSEGITAPGAALAADTTATATAVTPATPTAAVAPAPVAVTPVLANRAVAPVAVTPGVNAAADTSVAASAAVVTPAATTTATASVAAATAVSTAPAGISSVEVGGLLPTSSPSPGLLPGLTMAAGMALVLLSLGAFVKSGRTVLGGRGMTPLAG